MVAFMFIWMHIQVIVLLLQDGLVFLYLTLIDWSLLHDGVEIRLMSSMADNSER
jgi:hypothetical protein